MRATIVARRWRKRGSNSYISYEGNRRKVHKTRRLNPAECDEIAGYYAPLLGLLLLNNSGVMAMSKKSQEYVTSSGTLHVQTVVHALLVIEQAKARFGRSPAEPTMTTEERPLSLSATIVLLLYRRGSVWTAVEHKASRCCA